MYDEELGVNDHLVPTEIKIPTQRDTTIGMDMYLPGISYYDIKSRIPADVNSNYREKISNNSCKGIVLFGPAMAVRQGYYRYFLDYLSNQGYLVYSFDFSGIDKSKNKAIKGSDITLHDWIDDLQNVVNYVIDNAEIQISEFYQKHNANVDISETTSLPYYYLCHSLGGQLFGFLDHQNTFDKFVGITSQNGYWRFYKNKYRYLFFWYLFVPILVKLYGYFPSKQVGFGEDLPPEIMRRWKKWCISENYFFDDTEYAVNSQYDQYDGAMFTFSFEDDPWATPDAVNDLYQHYTNSNHNHKHFTPDEFGLDEIGHLGFFRPKCVELWNYCIDWLETA